MANWLRRLPIKSEWQAAQKGEITHIQLAGVIADRLAALAPLTLPRHEDSEQTRSDLVGEFRSMSQDETATVDAFDCLLAELYNWADDDHVCWVETL